MADAIQNDDLQSASDQFIRWYKLVLGVLVLLGLAWWLGSIDREAGRLNGALSDDPIVHSYPYEFRVLRLRHGVAVLSTPRGSAAPALRFLRMLKPELAGKPDDDPLLQRAQQELAEIQAHARSIVLADPAVERVRWELDRQWYESRGVLLGPG